MTHVKMQVDLDPYIYSQKIQGIMPTIYYLQIGSVGTARVCMGIGTVLTGAANKCIIL